VKETTVSKLRELWAIRRRCKAIKRAQREAEFLPSYGESVVSEKGMPVPAMVLACFSACFLAACVLHVRDILRHGWLPYHSAPLALNCYWTALLILDFAAAVLLVIRPRRGLIMALVIMISDLAVNLFARFDLHFFQHARGTAMLLLQFFFFAVLSAVVLLALAGREVRSLK
jgi:hypothetical protein